MVPAQVLAHLVGRQQIPGVLPPPPGVTPNFEHPASHGHYLSLTSVVCVVIAAVFVFARLWVKLVVSRAPGWDDVTSVLALIFSVILSILNILSVNKWGVGHHLWDVPETYFVPFLKARRTATRCVLAIAYGAQVSLAQASVYVVAVYFAKLTIAVLLHRIFGVNNKFRVVALIVISTWTLYSIIALCLIVFECSPIRKAWNPLLPGRCIDIIHLGVSSGLVAIAYDVILLVLPIPMVLQLQLAKKMKLAVIGIFMTGTFVLIASIVREVEVVKTLRDPDATWHNSNSLLWLVIETNVSIVCGCMPVLRPLVSRVFPSILYGGKQTPYKSTDYKLRNAIPKTSAPGKSYGDPGLMDASYIELGPSQNNHTNVTANRQRPPENDEGILKTHTFGTNVSYQERDLS